MKKTTITISANAFQRAMDILETPAENLPFGDLVASVASRMEDAASHEDELRETARIGLSEASKLYAANVLKMAVRKLRVRFTVQYTGMSNHSHPLAESVGPQRVIHVLRNEPGLEPATAARVERWLADDYRQPGDMLLVEGTHEEAAALIVAVSSPFKSDT